MEGRAGGLFSSGKVKEEPRTPHAPVPGTLASRMVPPPAPILGSPVGRRCGAGAASEAGGATELGAPPLPRSRLGPALRSAEPGLQGERSAQDARRGGGAGRRGGVGGRGGADGQDWLQARRTGRSARSPPRHPAPHAAFTWRRPSLPRAARSGTWARRAPCAAARLVEALSFPAQWPVFVFPAKVFARIRSESGRALSVRRGSRSAGG